MPENANQAPSAPERMLRQVIDTIPSSIFWKDVALTYLGCNQNFARAAGLSDPAEVVGKTDYDLAWSREKADEYRAADQAVLDQRRPQLGSVEVRTDAGGNKSWVMINKIPLVDESGAITGLLGILEDVTEQMQATIDRQRSEQLERLATIEAALSQAVTEEEILSALAEGFALDPETSLTLNYIDVAEDADEALAVYAVAGWAEGGIQHENPLYGVRFTAEQFPIMRLWLDQPDQILFVSDVERDSRVSSALQSFLGSSGIQAMAILPLHSAGRWQGNVGFYWPAAHEFDADEVFLMSRLLESLAATVARRRADLAQQETLTSLEMLYQAGLEMNMAQSFEAVLSVLRRYTFLGEEPQVVALNLFNRPWTEAETPDTIETLTRWTKLDPSQLRSRYHLEDFPSARQLLRRNEPTIIENLAAVSDLDEGSRALFVEQLGVKCAVFIPLIAGGDWLGFINAFYQQPKSFPAMAVRNLVSLAGHAAVAVRALNELTATARQAHRERLLFETSTNMGRLLDRESILKLGLEVIGRELNQAGVILQLDPQAD